MSKLPTRDRIAHGLRTRVMNLRVSAPLVALVLITFLLTVIMGMQ